MISFKYPFFIEKKVKSIRAKVAFFDNIKRNITFNRPAHLKNS